MVFVVTSIQNAADFAQIFQRGKPTKQLLEILSIPLSQVA